MDLSGVNADPSTVELGENGTSWRFEDPIVWVPFIYEYYYYCRLQVEESGI